MPDAPLLGRPFWYELQTPDLAAAEKFYAHVVGWTVSSMPGLPYRYTRWMRSGGVAVGGGLAFTDEMRGEGVRPNWMFYAATPSVETTVGLAERLGGVVVSPIVAIPGLGRMQALRDPQGALFSLFEPTLPPQRPEAPAVLGDVAWLELVTTDAVAGLAFYQALLGWRGTEVIDMGPAGPYRMFGRQPGLSLGGVMDRPPELAGRPSHWSVYFRVADVRTAASRAQARGAHIVQGPTEVPGGGWIVQGVDPQGAPFSLFHHKT
jgi:predicted enzyme related to lactoylglutathione lyase